MTTVEISDETQTVLDMTVGQGLLIGTIAEYLCAKGVIDRSDLAKLILSRAASFGPNESSYALPFEIVGTALRSPQDRSARGSLRLVHDRDSEDGSSRDSASGPR